MEWRATKTSFTACTRSFFNMCYMCVNACSPKSPWFSSVCMTTASRAVWHSDAFTSRGDTPTDVLLTGTAVQDQERRTPPIPTARLTVPMLWAEALQLCYAFTFRPGEDLIDATMQVWLLQPLCAWRRVLEAL